MYNYLFIAIDKSVPKLKSKRNNPKSSKYPS